MKKVNISETITELRKQKGITQEQLANALSLSPQAISKWETGTTLPDTMTLPLVAEYFGVSIDYLFYGQEYSYDDLYGKVFQKVAAHPQMSGESYRDALAIFASAHHGISHGNLWRDATVQNEPAHISNEHGLSLLSGRGYGAIVTREFFEGIGRETADFAEAVLPVLSDKNNLLVLMAILSMSDISITELRERLATEEAPLRSALDALIAAGLVTEKRSKHKTLGFTYEVNAGYHTCLCLLLATVEMQRLTLGGISCCMGYGDYPIGI